MEPKFYYQKVLADNKTVKEPDTAKLTISDRMATILINGVGKVIVPVNDKTRDFVRSFAETNNVAWTPETLAAFPWLEGGTE